MILSGSGRVKLDDELVEVKEMDVIRVEPEVRLRAIALLPRSRCSGRGRDATWGWRLC